MSQLAMFGGTPVRSKPFPGWPVFDESEERALIGVLRSGTWWRNSQGESWSFRAPDEDGPKSKVAEFQEAFARFHKAQYGLACASGTAALEIALKAAEIGPGDEVVVPAYTFVATATAPLSINATPVFCDIQRDTLNLDPASFEQAITSRTRAVVPVHFAGMPADMERILNIARRHRLFVLEDAAHAHGASWNSKRVGTIGNAGTFSFQGSKNMTAGEGGEIVSNDREFMALCESYLWAGREVGRPWYEHHRLGWNYRLTEFQAAILLAQLNRVEQQNAKRMSNGLHLNAQLARIPGIAPLSVPPFATGHTFHLYVFRVVENEFGASREDVLSALQHEGIPCSAGYAYPLYRNPMFVNRDFYPHKNSNGRCLVDVDYSSFAERCPNAERACKEAIWLEHRILLADPPDMDDVVRALAKIHDGRAEFQKVGIR